MTCSNDSRRIRRPTEAATRLASSPTSTAHAIEMSVNSSICSPVSFIYASTCACVPPSREICMMPTSTMSLIYRGSIISLYACAISNTTMPTIIGISFFVRNRK